LTTTSLTPLLGTALNALTTAPAAVSFTTRLMALLPPTEPKEPPA
jgi:hypothetical protein